MLPILRIIPIGGVLMAVLILVLAVSPPREIRQGVAPDMVLVRGALIDRRNHPEWPQFLRLAAFRRADEIVKLSDLPDTPIRIAPIALPPERPVIVAPAAPAAAMVTVAPPADAPPKADAIVAAVPPAVVDDVKADATAAVPAAAAEAAPTIKTAPTAEAGDTPAVPLPLQRPETPTQVAGLPMERQASDPDAEEITGTISASNEATIPVDIGETSSTELPVVLPRERPPVLHNIERGRSSLRRRERHERRPARRAKAVAKPSPGDQPASRVNLFDALFANAEPKDQPQVAKRGKAPPTPSGNPAYPHIIFYPITSP